MRRHARFLLAALAWACLAPAGSRATAGEPPPRAGTSPADAKDREGFLRVVRPFLSRHCASCHGAKKPRAGLNLEAMRDEATFQTRRRAWVRVREYIEGGHHAAGGQPAARRGRGRRASPRRSRRRSTATTAASRPIPAA